MFRRVLGSFRLLVLSLAFANASIGQTLYVLRGTTNPSLSRTPPYEVFAVQESTRSVRLVKRVAEAQTNILAAYCLPSYDHRVAVVGFSRVDAYGLQLLSLDSNQVENRQERYPDLSAAPLTPPDLVERTLNSTLGVGWFLVERPNLGLALLSTLSGPRGRVDYAIPIRNSALLRPAFTNSIERAGIRTNGDFGLGGERRADAPGVAVNRGFLEFGGRLKLPLGVPAPEARVGPAAVGYRLFISDQRALVLGGRVLSEAGDGSSELFALDRGTNRWSQFAVPGSDPRVRGFGKWIAGLAAVKDLKRERPRPGREAIADIMRGLHPDANIVGTGALWDRTYYPGVLFIINVETGKMFTLRTNQTDSEVLWVDDNVIYYRSANQIFKAPFVDVPGQGRIIGPASPVAQADVLMDVHFAYLGR